MQAPGGPDEDPSGGFAFGGWTAPHFDEEVGALMDGAMGREYDLLLGRRTYEIFAAFWPAMDDEIAQAFNAIDKFVAAGADTPMTWSGSHRLEGDVVEAVRRLKQTDGRDLLIQGSSELIHTLLEASNRTPSGVVVSHYTLGGEVQTGSFVTQEPGELDLARRERLAREG